MIICDYCEEEIDPRDIDLGANSRPGVMLDYHNECREAWESRAKDIKGPRPKKEEA